MTVEPLRSRPTIRAAVRCVHVRAGVYVALVAAAAFVTQFVR